MSIGSLLSKSGVALRKSNTPKKRFAVGLPKFSTPAGRKRKLTESTKLMATSGNTPMGNSKQGRRIVSEDSESYGQPLASRRVIGKLPLALVAEVQPAISIQPRGSQREVSELAATEQEATTSKTGAMAVSEKIDGAET